MYYVLFTWIKGRKERDFQGFKTEPELIDFLGKNFEKIMVWNIHKAAMEYRFGLVEKEPEPDDYLGPLSAKEEKEAYEQKTGQTVMCKTEIITAQDATDAEKKALDGIKGKQHPFLKDRKEEPSAMEKIADTIEEEQKEETVAGPIVEQGLTDEEIIKQNKEKQEAMGKPPSVKETLERGEKAIKAAELEQGRKKDWPKCPECKGPMAPWNKTGKCATCSRPKGTRPYKRRAKKEEDLPF